MALIDNSLNLVVGADVSELNAELTSAESDLQDLAATGQKVRLLEAAEQNAKNFSIEIESARQKVQALQTTISEAYASGGDNKLISDLSRQLAAAERESVKAAAAFEKNSQTLFKLKREALEAGINIHDLASESIRLDRAAQAAAALGAAFRTLGVKPLQDVRAETVRLQAALATIKDTGIIGPDQDRAIAAFKTRLAELRGEAGKIHGTASSAQTSLSGLGNEARNTSVSLGGAAAKAGAFAAALVGFNSISDVAKDVITTGAAFEALEARLGSLLGSTDAAQEAMAQIKALAISTPFEVSALADSFVKLTAFGLQPSMEQMKALADTAATLGGGTENLAGVTTALGQAWAKGKLQGEEILQMAERGVPVWDLLSTATGKSTAELQKMSEAGELGRGTIIKLIEAMGQMNAGASEKLMATFSGAVSNAKDALAEFYEMIAKAGVLDFLTGQLQDLLAEFERMKQTGELDAAAKRMADSFVAIGEGVRTAVEAVNYMSGLIKVAVEVFAAWKLAGMTLIPVLAAVGRTSAVAAVEATALSTASNAAALGVGRLATAVRLLKGLTLVGLIEGAVSMGIEFFRAKAAAEAADKAIKKMLEPTPINGPAKAMQDSVVATEAARFKLTEYQRAMIAAQEQGKTTGDALAEMVKKADLGSVKGVSDLLTGLDSVRKGAQATGEQIQTSIQDRLNKMSGSELREFGIMAQSAFNQGSISAGQLAATLNGQVDAALKGLGSSLEVSAGGMTAKFMEVAQQIGVVEASYDRLKETGQNAGEILKAAFDGGLNTAKSVQDLEGLAVVIRKAGEEGRLSKQEVGDFLDSIKAKVDAATPGINSLAEAFKTLGMKSQEELSKAAKSAEDAFTVIKNGSGYTQIELANVREAFKRYAEAAIAANGGVATDTIRVKAELYGLRIEADASGKAMIKLAEDTTTASQSADTAADSYKGLSDSLDGVADSASKAGENMRSAATGAYQSPTAEADFIGLAMKRGANPNDSEEIQKLAGQIFSEDLAKSPTVGELGIRGLISNAVDKAMGQVASKGQASAPPKTSASTVSAPIYHRIDLRMPRGVNREINLVGQSDVSSLLAILEESQSRSY